MDLKDDYDAGQPEIRLDVDKERASLLGVSTTDIAMTVEGGDQRHRGRRLPRSRRGVRHHRPSSREGEGRASTPSAT